MFKSFADFSLVLRKKATSFLTIIELGIAGILNECHEVIHRCDSSHRDDSRFKVVDLSQSGRPAVGSIYGGHIDIFPVKGPLNTLSELTGSILHARTVDQRRLRSVVF